MTSWSPSSSRRRTRRPVAGSASSEPGGGDMGFFTDFVIADPAEAQTLARAIDEAGTPLGEWSGFSVSAINDLDLAGLYSLLLAPGSAGEAVDLVDQFTRLYDEEDLPTVQLVPPPFVDLL